MDKQTLQAEVREERGKGPARRLRARGMIPAVFYGPGLSPTPIAVSPKELVKALTTDLRRNVLFALAIDGREEIAMIKALDLDPLTQELLHADFYRIDPERTVLVHVPFATTGRSIGVQKGAELSVVFRDLPVRARPGHIPAVIEVDVTSMDLNDVIEVKDLSLPEGVSVVLPPTRTLVIVAAERKKGDEEAEGEGAAATAAAAPAAS